MNIAFLIKNMCVTLVVYSTSLYCIERSKKPKRVVVGAIAHKKRAVSFTKKLLTIQRQLTNAVHEISKLKRESKEHLQHIADLELQVEKAAAYNNELEHKFAEHSKGVQEALKNIRNTTDNIYDLIHHEEQITKTVSDLSKNLVFKITKVNSDIQGIKAYIRYPQNPANAPQHEQLAPFPQYVDIPENKMLTAPQLNLMKSPLLQRRAKQFFIPHPAIPKESSQP